MDFKAIQSVWAEHSQYLASEVTDLDMSMVNQRMAALVCPGPFYHYIIDFLEIKFDNISESYWEMITGEPTVEKREIPSVEAFIQQIHPDDLAHVARCEELASKFLFEFLEPEQLLKYKVSYCFRLKVADGSYKMMLHQAIGLTLDPANGLGKVLGVHADISHLTKSNNYQISFFHLERGPSYTRSSLSDPSETSFLEAPTSPVSSREAQVLRLISEGKITREIAMLLSISEATVRKHRENLLRKTSSANTAQLVAHAIRAGLI